MSLLRTLADHIVTSRRIGVRYLHLLESRPVSPPKTRATSSFCPQYSCQRRVRTKCVELKTPRDTNKRTKYTRKTPPELSNSKAKGKKNEINIAHRLKSASSVPLTTLARSNVASAACPKSAIAASSFSYASSSFSSELFLLSSPSSCPRSNDDEIANASRHQSAEGPN